MSKAVNIRVCDPVTEKALTMIVKVKDVNYITLEDQTAMISGREWEIISKKSMLRLISIIEEVYGIADIR